MLTAGDSHFMLGTLASWGIDADADTVDTAILCLSELVTNAMIHTDAGCELRVVLDRGVLTTTVPRRPVDPFVVDLGNVTIGIRSPSTVSGLQLVDALSTRWGSELDTVGMTVWFVLEPT